VGKEQVGISHVPDKPADNWQYRASGRRDYGEAGWEIYVKALSLRKVLSSLNSIGIHFLRGM
jgi:hypothetical protein